MTNCFVIGTIGRTTGIRKLVKNLKYTKRGLVVGALDQFVMKFWGDPSVLRTVEAIGYTFTPTKSANS